MFEFFPIFDFFGSDESKSSTALLPSSDHPKAELQWPASNNIPRQGIVQNEIMRHERHNADGSKDVWTWVRGQMGWRN